jgi:hypothetical protein
MPMGTGRPVGPTAGGLGAVPVVVLARLGLHEAADAPELCCQTAGDTIQRASTEAGGGETNGAELTNVPARLYVGIGDAA